jgi:hypothetical protein
MRGKFDQCGCGRPKHKHDPICIACSAVARRQTAARRTVKQKPKRRARVSRCACGARKWSSRDACWACRAKDGKRQERLQERLEIREIMRERREAEKREKERDLAIGNDSGVEVSEWNRVIYQQRRHPYAIPRAV